MRYITYISNVTLLYVNEKMIFLYDIIGYIFYSYNCIIINCEQQMTKKELQYKKYLPESFSLLFHSFLQEPIEEHVALMVVVWTQCTLSFETIMSAVLACTKYK